MRNRLMVMPKIQMTNVECRLRHSSFGFRHWLCLAVALSAGCREKEASGPSSAAVAIPVSQPVQRQVVDYVDFTGRTDAVESVSIRARVTGYLEQMPFQEGREIAKGDTLFTIDPRPYKAQLDQAESQVRVNEASLNLAKATLARDQAVAKSAPGAVSQQQLDQDLAAELEAEAQLQATKASTEVYKLNLQFTTVTSPIDGMVSRYYYTRGNLVIQDQTLLTTVVSLDPMYAYFDLDETTLVRIRQGINAGRVKRYKDRSEIPVYMALQGEEGYPHQGGFDFLNNVVNPSTGSVATRAKFENPKLQQGPAAWNWYRRLAFSLTNCSFLMPQSGVRMLMPGMFVRIRLPVGQPHGAMLVIDSAIASDQGLKYVYVLDSDNKLQYRRVRTGPLQPDGLRVIEESTRPDEGLRPDDWLVVSGLQQVKPQMVITPDRQPMPTLGGGEQGSTSEASSSAPATTKPQKSFGQPKDSGKPKTN